jgi:hypothetical protein
MAFHGVFDRPSSAFIIPKDAAKTLVRTLAPGAIALESNAPLKPPSCGSDVVVTNRDVT